MATRLAVLARVWNSPVNRWTAFALTRDMRTDSLARQLRLLLFLLVLLPMLANAAAYSDETLSVDGRLRRYLVHDFSGSEPAPLVILLHGGGGNGENMVEQTGFDAVAAREGLVAVYPYGTSALFDNVLLTWNAGHCCSHAMREDVDDVRFIWSCAATTVVPAPRCTAMSSTTTAMPGPAARRRAQMRTSQRRPSMPMSWSGTSSGNSAGATRRRCCLSITTHS
ncbi:MAG: hypothetical protein ACO1PZ_08135 [Gammaproteobacteria bacterium]